MQISSWKKEKNFLRLSVISFSGLISVDMANDMLNKKVEDKNWLLKHFHILFTAMNVSVVKH